MAAASDKTGRAPVEGQLLYAVPQAACVLGLSARTLWNFIAHGEIRIRRVGTRVLLHRKELEKFAARDHKTTEESLKATV